MHFLSVSQAALVVLRKVAEEGSGALSAHIPPQTTSVGLGLSVTSVLTGKEFSGQLKSLRLLRRAGRRREDR